MATITDTKKVNPNTLLVDVNVRADLRLNKDFVASIKDHGVLQPIVAVETPDGLRVRMGHRRVAAAIEAGVESVPVLVIDNTNEGDAETIERLLTQHAENHHRASLTTAEDANVAHQLSLLGLSPTQIAKRTHTKKADVDLQLKVAASELAAKATDRYDLTLDQAVVVAEFEDDTETVKALIAAAKTGKFEHVAQQARDARAEAEAKAPVIAALTEAGVTILDTAPRHGEDAKRVEDLVDVDKKPVDEAEHATCPGHAVYLKERTIHTEPNGNVLDVDRWGYAQWAEGDEPATEEEAEARIEACTVTTEWYPAAVCTDPKAHKHYTRSQWYDMQDKPRPASEKSDEEREADRAARRLVIDNNKAWKSAREVRREWVKTYLTHKTLPQGAGAFMAQAMTAHTHLLGDTAANGIAAEWFGAEAASFGTSSELASLAAKADDKRALVITLGTLLAGCEKDCSDNEWRHDGTRNAVGSYLRFLATLGYTLSDVEEYAVSDQTV